MTLFLSLLACENLGVQEEPPETVGVHLCVGTDDPDVRWDFETQEVVLEAEVLSITDVSGDANVQELNLVPCEGWADTLVALKVQDEGGDEHTWTVGLGLAKLEGSDAVGSVTPALDLVAGQRVSARFLSVQSWGSSQALLLSDDEGLVFAADESAWGAPLGDVPWEGLMLSQGDVQMRVNDECGLQDWRERIFEADQTVSVANGMQAEVQIDGRAYTALNAVNFDWVEVTCTDMGGSGAWAIWR